jgi:hypothetical protein
MFRFSFFIKKKKLFFNNYKGKIWFSTVKVRVFSKDFGQIGHI